MSVSRLGDLVQKAVGDTTSNRPFITVDITVVSVLSNPKLIQLATDTLNQQRQRLQLAKNDKTGDANISPKNGLAPNVSSDIRHVIIPLKDAVNSDLLSVLPNALTAIDEALGHHANHTTQVADLENDSKSTNNTNEDDYNLQRICLVHCAKGASRSVSVVIAYLLSRKSQEFKNFDEALEHVRTVRPQAMPNIGFALALRQFERKVRNER